MTFAPGFGGSTAPMRSHLLRVLNTLATLLVGLAVSATAQTTADETTIDPSFDESRLLGNTRQLTFEGRRAGEGYFSADGTKMVFQSERLAENPFFQIYVLDFETGDIERISPGHGKTTCAWIHPQGDRVLYASTQDDPQAKAKQKEELELRASGEERRYSWDYDETYELVEYDRNAKSYRNLTNTRGYDAEASYSPDGDWIVFASNRAIYEQESLTDEQQERLNMDPSFFMDLYLMDASGKQIEQLTKAPGYDGGPFFSADGKKICWRRFTPDGARAEIMTMDLASREPKQLTKLDAMSWAPYFHPSGEYLIFATNLHGFANFELYLVDAQGKSKPVRVTNTEGFDGLPVFTPDGKRLSWTTNRGASKQSQIYLADWDHEQARELLGLNSEIESDVKTEVASEEAKRAAEATRPDCSPRDILRHVDYLCRPELAGRRTGTPGERLATAYVASYLDQLGFTPAGDNGSWFQTFSYTSGVGIGKDNQLIAGNQLLTVQEDWSPISFSNSGKFAAAPVVFAGYGIAAPEADDQEEYDSFVHLDVAGKWVLAFRFMPEEVTPERRQHLSRHSSLRYKAMLARDKGAHGLILVSGPNSSVRDQLVKLRFDGSLSSSSLPIISVTDEVAAEWLRASGKSIKELQDKLDAGDVMMGFQLDGLKVSTTIDIDQKKRQGRNVLGRLQAGDQPSDQVLVVGAHIDHLGVGVHSSSLARDQDRNEQAIHWGADDNASGVAAMLEIAQWIAGQKEAGKLEMKRDILFAAWSGEEDGLIGSSHFVKNYPLPALHHHAAGDHAAHGDGHHAAHAAHGQHDAHDAHAAGHTKTDDAHASADPHAAHSAPSPSDRTGSTAVATNPHADPHAANPHAADPHAADPHTAAATDPHAAAHGNGHGDSAHGTKAGHGDSAEHSGTEHSDTEHSDAAHAAEHAHSSPPEPASLYPHIAACLNLDMVGRLEKKLILQGIGSSSIWKGEIERRNAVLGLPITLQNDSYIPTDASVFFTKGVPILSAFTGSHPEYHTPQDTPDKLNYDGAARVARFMALVTRSLAIRETAPDYQSQAGPEPGQMRARMRAYLGTVPDYAESDVKGVLLSAVSKTGPAAKAGVKGGDLIVELAGRKIENIYDYTYAIEALKIGQLTKIAVMRNGKKLTLDIIPSSRE